MAHDRKWDGRRWAVAFRNRHPNFPTGGVVDIQVGGPAASELANVLRKLQGNPGDANFLPPNLEELLTALDYVLVADPASSAAHRRMEASKGMEPSGG